MTATPSPLARSLAVQAAAVAAERLAPDYGYLDAATRRIASGVTVACRHPAGYPIWIVRQRQTGAILDHAYTPKGAAALYLKHATRVYREMVRP